jgi:hypothetical protein
MDVDVVPARTFGKHFGDGPRDRFSVGAVLFLRTQVRPNLWQNDEPGSCSCGLIDASQRTRDVLLALGSRVELHDRHGKCPVLFHMTI